MAALRNIIAAALMWAFTPGAGYGQLRTAVLDSLIRDHVHELTVEREQLSGPGAELILEAARGAAFVALGENHNTRAIPAFTVALLRMLQATGGFQYLALEEGPELGRRLSHAARTAESGGAFGVARRFPNAFHLLNENELAMIDRIGSLSAAAEPIWGLNQEFGLAHVYARLVEIAPDELSRGTAAELLRQSLVYEAERHARDTAYVSAIATPDDFRMLRAAFAPDASSEAASLIDQGRLSHAIYAPYRKGDAAHFTDYHRSNVSREENMKRLFAQKYRAHSADASRPRVLVKSGHTHLGRGRGYLGVLTLGNFLSELATAEGSRTLHLYAVLNWEDLSESWLAPFVPHLKSGVNTLIDLRHIEPWAVAGRLGSLDGRLDQLLTGYDILLVLADTAQASIETLCTPNFNWYTGIPGCR